MKNTIYRWARFCRRPGFWISLLIVLIPTPSFSAPLPKPLTTAYSSVSPLSVSLWIAQGEGFFRKHGLDVTVIYVGSGTTLVETMLAGEVPIAFVGGVEVVSSDLNGADLVMLGGIVNTQDYALLTPPDIKTVKQLKGKKVGVGRYGSIPGFLTRYLLKKEGLRPNVDVAIVQLGPGGQPLRFAALQSGAIQGILVSSPVTQMAQEDGFHEVLNLQSLGLQFPATTIATSRSFLSKNRDVVKRFMEAIVDALHFAKTRKEQTIGYFKKYLKIKDPKVLEETYSVVSKLYLRKPYPTMKGIQFVLNYLATKNPRAKGKTPGDFVDTGIVKELDESGYIGNLYR